MILAVFRSRSQGLDYAERLNRYGIFTKVSSAPKQAKIGCGLCVQFDGRVFPRANAILQTGRYTAFQGYYKTEYAYGRQTILPFR